MVPVGSVKSGKAICNVNKKGQQLPTKPANTQQLDSTIPHNTIFLWRPKSGNAICGVK